jgi:hypothetical protein
MRYGQIKHFLVINGNELPIGTTDTFVEHDEFLGYDIRKLATYPCPADTFIYLYQVIDLRCHVAYYFMVNHLDHRNEDGKYKSHINYGANEMLPSDDVVDAFVEFADKAKDYAY